MLEAVKTVTPRTPERVPDLLTPEGVQAFLENPSPEARAEAAAVIAREYAQGGFSDSEMELANTILETLAVEGEDLVREALSEHLKDCETLPVNLVRQLARDSVESVAVPILRCATALEDDDLMEIAGAGQVAQLIAIAKRDELTPEVAEALLESRNEKVIGALLGNKGADLPEPLLNRIIDEFGTFTSFHALLVDRPFLPLTVIARVLLLIPEEMKERLLERHELNAKFAQLLTRVSQENSISRDANKAPKAVEAPKLVQVLSQKDGLTPVLILRALLTGDLEFFESAMAVRTQMTVEPAKTLIYSSSEKGFKGLYTRANLPSELMRAFRIALDYIAEIGRDNAAFWRAEDTREIVKQLGNEFDEVCPAELRRLIGRLQRRLTNQSDKDKRGSVELAFSKAGNKNRGAQQKGPLRPAS
ncbi:MAG: DUF2336 domain-containing protein [Kiloniellales bacterium]|nr:DUF2336 domain-containing protein [Kiloniellales bacterium]MDJ0969213.1 DUF2336 domain-containing protein [Kiloniellales bacterium]MDJ0981975.1 DUF2336 domain-containing protein [Kiloniellales bacterium]